MKILFIASGFLPAVMSENLCNGKLILAFLRENWNVDVITRDSEISYSKGWEEPWLELKKITYEIKYPIGNRLERLLDTIKSSIMMCGYPIAGIRWARRAYQKALDLHKKNHYDVIITRSPSDIAHIAGYKFSKKTGVKWIANWNDPATNIWPFPRNYSWIKWYIHERYNHLILKNADITTFPAESLRDHFKSHYSYIDENKTAIVPHIALVSGFIKEYSTSSEENVFRLCYSGNICKDRDIEFLLEAICEMQKEHCKIRFDILGTSDEYTNNMISKYNIDCIHFLGSFPYLKALNIMSTYDVFILIEQRMDYGIYFPSKLVDYAQLNKPILAISPIKGFVSTSLTTLGGGIVADNTSREEVKNALSKLYKAWEEGNLSLFSPQKILSRSSCTRVVNIYKYIFKCIGCLN